MATAPLQHYNTYNNTFYNTIGYYYRVFSSTDCELMLILLLIVVVGGQSNDGTHQFQRPIRPSAAHSSPAGVGSCVSHWQGLGLQCTLGAESLPVALTAPEFLSHGGWNSIIDHKGSTKTEAGRKHLSPSQAFDYNQQVYR